MASWESAFNMYMANVGGAPTSFIVDMNAAPHAPKATHPLRIQLRVPLLRPLPNGLRDASELEPMGKVEDTICARLEAALQAIYVGRTLGAGYVTFFFYAPPAGDEKTDFAKVIGPLGEYKVQWLTEEDPKWSSYLDFLYPDEPSREQMTNRAQLEQRQKIGDNLDAERDIDHFAIFGSLEQASAAGVALIEKGFRAGEPSPRGEEGQHTLEFHRRDALSLGRPNVFCAEIRAILAPFAGEYDGWGAVVVKEDPRV